MDFDSVVIDSGSGNFRAGFSSLDSPLLSFPSVVGVERFVKENNNRRETFVGSKAQEKRDILSLSYPIEHGIVTNWDNMEKLLKYTFSEVLYFSPSRVNTLLTEVPLNPKSNKEKMSELMFERFHSKSIYIANPGQLSLYAAGRVSSIVLESGDGVTFTYPVYEGHTFPSAILRNDFAGCDVTNYLMELLRKKGYCFSTTCDREIVKDIKEKLCKVNSDCSEISAASKIYKLPDGQEIVLDKEIFECAEVLFRPELVDMEFIGIQELLSNALMECDVDARRDLFCNVMVTGGNTTFPGFTDRLKLEMNELLINKGYPSRVSEKKICRIFPIDYQHLSAWIGGSILSSLSAFKDMTISKKEYEEFGPCIVHRK
ncbi:Actin-5 [Nymphon striatum]|nr:Actin-5 [Nymphon striatum]